MRGSSWQVPGCSPAPRDVLFDDMVHQTAAGTVVPIQAARITASGSRSARYGGTLRQLPRQR